MELSPWQRIRTRVFLFFVGVKRRMTLGVRMMLIDGDRVFLIRHTYLPGWQLPGGGVEPGESAEDCAVREALEETGYRVLGRPQLLGFYHLTNRTTNRDYVAVYLSRTYEKAAEFKSNMEIAEAGWFDRNLLPADTTDGTLQRLAEVFGGEAPSAKW
jgi:ADP-ribose pyrophosphatase YjhB (NUDIX family)